jgi:hypothetical protein
MDSGINRGRVNMDLFGSIDGYSFIDLLTLKAIVNATKTAGASISISEISFKSFAYYWRTEFDSSNSKLAIQNFNDLRGRLMTRYGLSMESSENDIIQILNYAQDKSLEIKLFGFIKSSLNKLSLLGKNNISSRTQKQFGLIGKQFLKVKSSTSIQINPAWQQMIVENYSGVEQVIDIMINGVLYLDSKLSVGEFDESKDVEKVSFKKVDAKEQFSKLYDIERRIQNVMRHDKKSYSCLEEALLWLNMDTKMFEDIHDQYSKLIRIISFKKVTFDLPLLTVTMLLYSAIYLYNDDEAGGYWNGFFGAGTSYNYQRDVELAMQCIDHMAKKYGIDTTDRHYMEKKNISEIFSHIYLPEISLKKIFTALYSYYFRSRNHHLFNKAEFLEINQYRLDKPGLFFLSDDDILKDIFDSIYEMVDEGVNGRKPRVDELIPKRIYDAFESWLNVEKESIDHKREEYYISSPNIMLDNIDERIYLYLPKQKSRLYSDDECGWEIIIDGKKTFVNGRIIRQQSGAYLILDDKIAVDNFTTLKAAYIFNNKKQGEWIFNNDDEILVFDKKLQLQKKSVVKRDIAYLAVLRDLKLDDKCIFEKYEIRGWKGYIICCFDLSEYQGRRIEITKSFAVDIEDEPAVKRSNFKLLFENWNDVPVFETVNVYEHIGELVLTRPYIELEDIQIFYYELESGRDASNYLEVEKIASNKIQVTFSNEIPSNAYNITVKYKNRTCYRDSFIVDHETKVAYDNLESYEKNTVLNRTIRIQAGPSIEIINDNLDTRVMHEGDFYLIDAIYGSVANFIYKAFKAEILIRKIIKPVKIEVIGLAELLEVRETDKTKEITKEVLRTHEVGLYVKNLDLRHTYLIYELLLVDEISDNTLADVKKLKLGEDYSWNFKDLSDRITDYKNINVTLNISNSEGKLLYSNIVLHVTEHIRIHGFKTKIEDKIMTMSWREEQVNKQRCVSLYNITAPREEVHEYPIADGITELRIDLSTLSYGAYAMTVGFRKKQSLFDSIESMIEFFEGKRVKHVFINRYGKKNSQAYEFLVKCNWVIFREKYDNVEGLLRQMDSIKLNKYDVLITLIQIKYLAADSEKGITEFLKITYEMLHNLIKTYGVNVLIRTLLDNKDNLEKKDLLYILTAIHSINTFEKINEDIIDGLAEIDLVSALCSVENGSGSLSRNLISKCRESFDVELLSPSVIRNADTILKMIYKEAVLINEFWNWLTEHRNNYLLQHDFSKARLFRMYEMEKDFTTYKVAGRTIDDMVDNLVNRKHCLQVNVPERYQNNYNIDRGIYSSVVKLLNDSNISTYKDILSTAFISVAKLPVCSDKTLFEMSMRCELSDRSEIYNRYRAYLKLIFI